MKTKEAELVWAMLPEGLEEWFEIKGFEKNERTFRIILVEKNIVPELPEDLRGKRIVNTVLNDITIDDFPIRGRKGELVLERRSWKFEGVSKLFHRELDLMIAGTKLEKEFADFLKEFDRNTSGSNQYRGTLE